MIQLLNEINRQLGNKVGISCGCSTIVRSHLEDVSSSGSLLLNGTIEIWKESIGKWLGWWTELNLWYKKNSDGIRDFQRKISWGSMIAIFENLKNKLYLQDITSLVAQRLKRLPPMRVDPGSIPGSGRSPGEGNGNPLQYSCLENPMDGEAW